jgi:hypothetical protein
METNTYVKFYVISRDTLLAKYSLTEDIFRTAKLAENELNTIILELNQYGVKDEHIELYLKGKATIILTKLPFGDLFVIVGDKEEKEIDSYPADSK